MFTKKGAMALERQVEVPAHVFDLPGQLIKPAVAEGSTAMSGAIGGAIKPSRDRSHHSEFVSGFHYKMSRWENRAPSGTWAENPSKRERPQKRRVRYAASTGERKNGIQNCPQSRLA